MVWCKRCCSLRSSGWFGRQTAVTPFGNQAEAAATEVEHGRSRMEELRIQVRIGLRAFSFPLHAPLLVANLPHDTHESQEFSEGNGRWRIGSVTCPAGSLRAKRRIKSHPNRN